MSNSDTYYAHLLADDALTADERERAKVLVDNVRSERENYIAARREHRKFVWFFFLGVFMAFVFIATIIGGALIESGWLPPNYEALYTAMYFVGGFGAVIAIVLTWIWVFTEFDQAAPSHQRRDNASANLSAKHFQIVTLRQEITNRLRRQRAALTNGVGADYTANNSIPQESYR